MGSLWNRSGTVERDLNDFPASGALATFYEGGTTTLLVIYQDAGEASAHENPVEADSRGRWPSVFVPYTLAFDVLVTTADGQTLSFTEMIPNPDPIDLTVTIPAEEKIQTGMIHAELIAGTKAGYVRLNGRTMGSSASAGTERANDDTEDLFIYLWNALDNTHAAVSGGRGASGAADFAANKTITLINMQGATFCGLDDMGGSAGNNFAGLSFSTGNATTPGSRIGANSYTLEVGQLPSHSHTVPRGVPGAGTADGFASNISVIDNNQDTDFTGDGDLISNLQLTRLVTWYIKL